MLPARHRLRRSTDFSRTVRRGRAARSELVAVHVLLDAARPDAAPAVGLVVSRSVGGSVKRHHVQRRLRHLMADRLAALPGGSRVVVRALPPSASARWDELAAGLDDALARALAPPTAGRPAGGPVPRQAGASARATAP